jgi:hypothetical protein
MEWPQKVVATRTHRTTKIVVGEAWTAERPKLRVIPESQAVRSGEFQ